jgi:hypothetical protein
MKCRLVHRMARLATIVAAFAALSPAVAWSTIKYWKNGIVTGSWSSSSNWSNTSAAGNDLGGVPSAGDTVSIVHTNGVSHTVTYDYAGPALSLGALTVDLTGGTGAATNTLSISANTLTTSIGEVVGASGSGAILQSGGTNNNSNVLNLGLNATGIGAYTQSGGLLAETDGELVGVNGSGVFTQTGGTNNIAGGGLAGSLYLGDFSNSSGTYNLSGTGSLSTNGEYIGYSGTGAFNQMGGTNTISSGPCDIGFSSGSSGMYTLSGGSASVDGLILGVSSGSNGTFTLNNGSLSSANGESVGFGGMGTFNQTGGTNTISSGSLNLGFSSGSTGTYTLSGGFASVSGITDVGNLGTGVLTVSGSGVLTVNSTLQIFNTPGTVVNLAGGTINAGGLNFSGVPALFNWTSGTLNITTNTTWDSAAAATSTGAAFGSALTLGSNQTLMITGNETLGGAGAFALTLNIGSSHYVTGGLTLSPTGTITQNTGSTLYAATFTQAGGTVNGTLQNQGNFIYQSGLFNGRLLNQGTLTIAAPNFTLANGIENDGSATVSAGQTLTANGAGLDNLGTFILSGGNISGSSPVLNDYSGTIQGHGTINPVLTNNGVLTVNGVLSLNNASPAVNNGILNGAGAVLGNFFNAGGGSVNVAGGNLLAINSAWSNSGLVTLQGNTAVLYGGTITNTGTIQGAGTVGAPVTNSTGTIRASGGELDLAGAGNTNAIGGLMQAATGNTLMVIQGLAANDGTIALTGGAFDNNNQALSNTGIINGYGTLRTGALTSTGKLNVGEGNLDVFGNVVNNGTIGIQGSRFAYFYGNVSGSGSYTGLGTATYLAALSPGNSPASVSYGGSVDLTSTATLDIDLGGTTVGSQYDKLNVAGQLALGGVLDVVLYNGFSPMAGNKFDILDWGTRTGTFSSVELPALAGSLTWNTSQLYKTGVLAVVDSNFLPGDFNRDGHVDAADILPMMQALTNLSAYKATYATGINNTQLALIEDVNGDGSFTNADLQGLLNLLKSGGGSVSAVPEPASIVLLAVTLPGLAFAITRRGGSELGCALSRCK